MDYLPRACKFDPELLDSSKIRLLACGMSHFTIVDSDHNMHTIGKVVNTKPIGNH